MHSPNQGKGILAGILAGVFWGTPFLVPMVLSDYNAFEVTFGRFFFFGLLSLLFFPRVLRLWRQLSGLDLLKIFGLSATGYWLYSLTLFYGVQATGGVIAALIIGCLPFSITLLSKPHFNIKLFFGLGLILVGLLCLLALPLLASKQQLTLAHNSAKGLLAVLVALIMWTHFAIKNAGFMARRINIKAMDYACLIGLFNWICVVPSFGFFYGFDSILAHADLWRYVFWCAILGLGASWIANILWTYSAKNCSPAIGGCLIVSETIFGLLYSFVFESRWPHANELIAMIALILGVILSIRSQLKKF